MRCTACGSEQSGSARFCGACGAALASSCPTCGDALAPDVRFCTSCGTPVDDPQVAARPAAVEAAAERRRISVLFLDLEDFTALAETLDPEEVRAVQSRYFETARSVIAGYGGTVEKFIGDAVVAIWGAPVAHEDDAQRAVRAALALVDAIRRLGGATAKDRLSGRASVTTGEAAVNVGAVGHGLVAGDLVNVASRLQAQAPTKGVLVDEATRELAEDAASYVTVGALELKGRRAPLTAFRAEPHAASDTASRGAHGGPFVGRDQELRELVELHEGVVRDGRCRLVSVTGIAGIGKSRLVWELARQLDERPDLVAWHAGRAPAYGHGITFAAIAEMVRHRIRIGPEAPPEIARRQLAASLGELVRDRDERAWLDSRLGALLGQGRLDAFERDELFAAWRRYFERVADTTPAVLVFEDLQWADPGLVDFVEHLATWGARHPILILALARPELLDRRPTFGVGAARFTALHLERLPDEEMRTLLALRAPQLDGATIERVLAHAGGVPLYAVELARSLHDRADGQPPSTARGSKGQRAGLRRNPRTIPSITVPDSLHGLVAARIDALPAPERRLLLAAAVLGRRFPADALVAIGAERATIGPRVGALVQRELLTIADGKGTSTRTELSFIQDVVREVAYGTLSRQDRRALHLAAARWLEAIVDDDVAEPLAGHLAAVHDLAPDHPDATRVARRAISALRRAAAGAMERHLPERALRHLEQALVLVEGGSPRATVLDEAASAATAAGSLELAERHLRELASLQLAAGHRREAARTRARLAGVLLTAQRNEPAVRELEMALQAIRHVGRDAAGVELAAQLARARMLIGDDAGAVQWANRGLKAAARLGLDSAAADLLTTRGTARVDLGDQGGLSDLEKAIADAARIGAVRTELRARNNLAWLRVADDPRTTLEVARDAVGVATTMGVGDLAAQLAEVACAAALDTGDWAWAIETAEELLHPGTPIANRINLAAIVMTLRSLSGDGDAQAALHSLEPIAEDADRQVAAGVRLARAWHAFTGGDLGATIAHADAAADGLLGIERLQAMVLGARARLWNGDVAGAGDRLERLDAARPAGRVPDAHIATLRAGLTSLDDQDGARTEFRSAAAEWRALRLDGDLAVCRVDEAHLTGRPPTRATTALLDRIGAAGLRRLVEGGNARAG